MDLNAVNTTSKCCESKGSWDLAGNGQSCSDEGNVAQRKLQARHRACLSTRPSPAQLLPAGPQRRGQPAFERCFNMSALGMTGMRKTSHGNYYVNQILNHWQKAKPPELIMAPWFFTICVLAGEG